MKPCSVCRQPKETVRFHDPQHGFVRVCETCWGRLGWEKGWVQSLCEGIAKKMAAAILSGEFEEQLLKELALEEAGKL